MSTKGMDLVQSHSFTSSSVIKVPTAHHINMKKSIFTHENLFVLIKYQ